MKFVPFLDNLIALFFIEERIFQNQVFTLYVIQAQCRHLCRLKPCFWDNSLYIKYPLLGTYTGTDFVYLQLLYPFMNTREQDICSSTIFQWTDLQTIS